METLLATLHDEMLRKLERPRFRRAMSFASAPGKIDVAIGMRRSGKTFFLLQIIGDLLGGGAPPDSLLYVNFEDDRLAPLSLGKAAALVDAFYASFPRNHERTCHLFLDEVQQVPEWPLLVRRLFDTKDVRLYLAGSSSRILSSEIAASLRGRALSTEVWPLSFSEYLEAIGAALPDGGPLPRRVLDGLRRHLLEYLRSGGFPEIVSLNPTTAVRVLQDYVNVVVLRDVVERHGLTNIGLARYMARTLVRGAAKRFTINKLHADLRSQGTRVAKNTLHAHLGHFEDAYLVFAVPLWSDSLRKVQTNPRKIYAVDPGLATAMNPSFSANFGQMFENLVYLDLRRQGYDVYYYLTKERHEVDFLARDPLGRIRLIQACFDADAPSTADRERRALEEASRELGVDGELITPESYLGDLARRPAMGYTPRT